MQINIFQNRHHSPFAENPAQGETKPHPNASIMKITLITLAIAALTAASAQAATIFQETIGTVTGTTAIADHETANGFDNDAFTFSGVGDLRATTVSSGYTGASGSANAFLTNNGTSSFIISGISTADYTAGSFGLTFGAYKSTTASNLSELQVSWSSDSGATWNSLAFDAQPTGAGTSNWRLVTVTNASTIATTSTLSFRFVNSSSGTGTAQIRVDDITFTGDPIPEPSAALLGGLSFLALLRRRR